MSQFSCGFSVVDFSPFIPYFILLWYLFNLWYTYFSPFSLVVIVGRGCRTNHTYSTKSFILVVLLFLHFVVLYQSVEGYKILIFFKINCIFNYIYMCGSIDLGHLWS